MDRVANVSNVMFWCFFRGIFIACAIQGVLHWRCSKYMPNIFQSIITSRLHLVLSPLIVLMYRAVRQMRATIVGARAGGGAPNL